MPTPASVGVVSGARGMAFRLIGIVYEAGVADAVCIAGQGAAAFVFRDVAALVRSCSPRADPPAEAALLEHHTIIAGLARSTTIIPAPPVTIFRTQAAVLQWLELHANALADGLAYAEGRSGARVTAVRDIAGATSDPDVLPPSAAAVESFRVLRRYAKATVPVSTETVGDGTTIATEAFLVERTSWESFADEVAAEDIRSPGLILRLTGPWPVYDFVRLQF